MLVIGKKEEDGNTLSIRTREGDQRFGVKLDDFVAEVRRKEKSFE